MNNASERLHQSFAQGKELDAARKRIVELEAQKNEALTMAIDFLDSEAQQLREWAIQSHNGGWSTHQVGAMKKRADEIDRLIMYDLRFALRGERPWRKKS